VAAPAVPVSNKPDEVSSEENFFRARSDEYFSDDDIEVDAEDNEKEEVKEVSSSSSRDNNKKVLKWASLISFSFEALGAIRNAIQPLYFLGEQEQAQEGGD
jgi:hypothetical protein